MKTAEKKIQQYNVMGIGISAIDMDDARSFIEDAISNRKKTPRVHPATPASPGCDATPAL
jgi:hypothetical protein